MRFNGRKRFETPGGFPDAVNGRTFPGRTGLTGRAFRTAGKPDPVDDDDDDGVVVYTKHALDLRLCHDDRARGVPVR